MKFNTLITTLFSVVMLTTACKKEKCEDPDANNFGDNVVCTYPSVTANAGGSDGDVTGGGGTVTSTHEWTNNSTTAELNFDITSGTTGSMQVVIRDANGTIVIDETLDDNSVDDSITACSSGTTGVAGTWTVTIILTDFNGDGSYGLSQGC